MSEMEKYKWAVREQGYEGSYDEWLALPADDRDEYETGAQGIGTEPRHADPAGRGGRE